MIRNTRYIASLLTAIGAAFILLTLYRAGTARSEGRKQTGATQSVTREMHLPYFNQDGAWETIVVLNNNTQSEKPVNVTLFNLRGESFAVPTISLPPYAVRRFDLEKWTRGVPQFKSGNIQVSFTGNPAEVTGQASVINHARHLEFESKPSSAMDYASNRLDGIIALPDKDATAAVALTNLGGTPIVVRLSPNVTLTQAVPGGIVFLGSHQTKVVDVTPRIPCSFHLALEHDGAVGSLAVTAYGINPSSGYAANFYFTDRATVVSPKLAGAHVRFGIPSESEGFPRGTTFEAPLVLANVGGLPSSATITADYTIGGQSFVQSLEVFQLTAGEVREVDLTKELAQHGIRGPVEDAGITIDYTGGPGTVIGHLACVSSDGDFSFDVPIKDPLAGMNRIGGSYPWRLDGDYKTVLHLKNILDKPVFATVQVCYDGGTYNPERIKLMPYQTVALDIKQLQDSQKKDIRGVALPPSATSGKVVWYEREPGSLTGRAETFNIGRGIAGSFSCPVGCSCEATFETADMSPRTYTALEGESAVFFIPQETDIDCNDMLYGPFDMSDESIWTSSDTTIAQVDDEGMVDAAAPGTTDINAKFSVIEYDSSCNPTHSQKTAKGTIKVQRPTSLGVVSITTLSTGSTGDFGCTSGQDYGIKINIQYQVKDQSGNDIKKNTMVPQEKVTSAVFNGVSQGDPVPDWSDIGPSRISGTSRTTDSNGRFRDAPFGICFGAPFTYSFTQQISILMPNNTRRTVKTHNLSASSSSSGQGTISNGSDVQKSRP